MKSLVACCCLAMLVLVHSIAFAKDYCQPMPKAKKESDPWYIPESAFTRKAANEALKELSNQVNAGVQSRDFLVDNELTVVKGYLYHAYLEEHEKAFGKEDTELREEFCKFLNKANVSH